MTDKISIMNQTETAAYINKHYQPMDGSWLSRLTKLGLGPDHQKKGNQKLFLQRDVDAWIEQQKDDDAA